MNELPTFTHTIMHFQIRNLDVHLKMPGISRRSTDLDELQTAGQQASQLSLDSRQSSTSRNLAWVAGSRSAQTFKTLADR